MILPVSAFAEPALAQEGFAVLIGAGNNMFARRLDPATNGAGENGRSWSMPVPPLGETLRGKLAVPDADFLEPFHAPQIAVHANGAR